jgi:hypothetical protein
VWTPGSRPRLVAEGAVSWSRQVTCLQRAELSGFCVGLRLDRRGCSFPQSTAEIGSDQQTMTLFCEAISISLRISPSQSRWGSDDFVCVVRQPAPAERGRRGARNAGLLECGGVVRALPGDFVNESVAVDAHP